MSVGSVFSDSKWQILKDLSQQKFSPIQLADKYSTTLGNVGHQLRILEAYGLVKKEKISNRDKGKPRTLFSLAQKCAYLVSMGDGFAEKKLLPMTDHHDAILRMWFVDDPALHYYLEKFYWKIEDHLRHIQGLAVKSVRDGAQVFILTSSKAYLREKIGTRVEIKNNGSGSKQFQIRYVNDKELAKLAELKDYVVVHDPGTILSSYKASLV